MLNYAVILVFLPQLIHGQWGMFPPGFPFGGFDFSRLQNIGQEIQETVARSLEPMQTEFAQHAMNSGVGGVTIVTINGKVNVPGIEYMMYDGAAYSCTGTIVRQQGQQPTCSGDLLPIIDVCVPGINYMQQNDVRCFGTTISMINGVCMGGIQATTAQLKARCGPNYNTNNYAKYEYYPTVGKHEAVDIANPNLRCQNSDRSTFCIFNGF